MVFRKSTKITTVSVLQSRKLVTEGSKVHMKRTDSDRSHRPRRFRLLSRSKMINKCVVGRTYCLYRNKRRPRPVKGSVRKMILDIESEAISQTGCGLEIVCHKSEATVGTKTLLRR